MLEALKDTSKADKLLTIKEASLLDLTDKELQDEVDQVDAVVSCLGHSLTIQGILGHPRRLVTDSVQRLTSAMAATAATPNNNSNNNNNNTTAKKFLLMGSDGVRHPAGTDDPRTGTERFILWLLRHVVQPHADNEDAAAYLYSSINEENKNFSWVVIRPTNLIDGDANAYRLMEKPPGALFGGAVATRANVAKFMVDLLTNDKLFEEYKMCMPVLHDAQQPEKK